jgi:hypothetical protein
VPDYDAPALPAAGHVPYAVLLGSTHGVELLVHTRIERDRVAAVLAELAGGTAPSTVARRVGGGYATVARIAERTKR